ncbi:hypothetical protein EON68_03785, partial [archaeon]
MAASTAAHRAVVLALYRAFFRAARCNGCAESAVTGGTTSPSAAAALVRRAPARALTLVYPVPRHYPAPSVLLQWSATASE